MARIGGFQSWLLAGREAIPGPLSVPPIQHQFRDFDVGGVGDLEDFAVSEDVAAAGGRRELDGGVPAGVSGIEAAEESGSEVRRIQGSGPLWVNET